VVTRSVGALVLAQTVEAEGAALDVLAEPLNRKGGCRDGAAL
jgi:hypothetical protein